MKIIIGGGTGLVGRALVPKLIEAGHEISVIGRDKNKIRSSFNHTVNALNWDELTTLNPDEFGAIINLTGENIAESRWSDKVKNKLLSSRLNATRKFILWGANATPHKPHLYNASAIGIYELQNKVPDKPFTEKSLTKEKANGCFSNQLVSQWEQAALEGSKANMPVTVMRFGVVLKRGEGMLKKLELPAQYGLSAVVGSGEQPLSWINHVDLVNAILFLIDHPGITGPINLVAPEYVSQKVFTKTMAEVLNKPAFLRLPSWFIKFALGQMGEELLLSGQAVAPERLLEQNFNFNYPTLTAALKEEFKK
jgi:uncharacterized protein (TIGR01777 family)